MKKRFIHTFIIVILISSILTFSYSIINIIKWNIANQKTKGNIEEINELVNIKETSDSSNTEIITNDDIEKNDPYWDYIKEDLINVDFQNLKEIKHVKMEKIIKKAKAIAEYFITFWLALI